jgi:hypothetical protein
MTTLGVLTMTALEFQTSLAPDGTLKVPKEVASQLEDVSSFRVLVLVSDEQEEDADWRRLGIEQFLKDDVETDSIYDDL